MKIKNLVQAIMLFFCLAGQAQSISPYLFGQNAWMPDSIGNVKYYGKLHKNWKKIKDSKASIIRFGGIAPDEHKPTNFQYVQMIDSIRAQGMEPMIQVPYNNGQYSAQEAATIVQYINVTKGKNIKYWIIGNEPNLGYNMTSASQIAPYIKSFATAMKAVDPNILTIGPEIAWFDKGIIDGLTQPNGINDITGKDANGRFYIDVISFHAYPMGNQTSGMPNREDLINKLTDVNQLEASLDYLNNRLTACNNTHNRTGVTAVKSAVTEMNVVYQNNANESVDGFGANSFIGGQFLAEMFGIGAKKNVSIMNIWSVIEGNTTESNCGYIDPSTGNKKPIYHHFKMMAENFKGNYVTSNDDQNNVKTFACKNNQCIQVLVMNQDIAANYNYVVRLDGSNIGGNSNLKINVQTGVSKEYNGVVNNQVTLLLTFDLNGNLIKKTEYSITNARNNQDPVVTTYSSNVVGGDNNITTGIDEIASDFISMKGFNMNVYPNPNKSKFNIELDRNNNTEVKFKVELFDLMGRLIYTEGSTFPGRKKQVDLTGVNLAEAVYIVRVCEEGDRDNFKTTKVICFK